MCSVLAVPPHPKNQLMSATVAAHRWLRCCTKANLSTPSGECSLVMRAPDLGSSVLGAGRSRALLWPLVAFTAHMFALVCAGSMPVRGRTTVLVRDGVWDGGLASR